MNLCERCGKRPGALLSFEQAAECLSVSTETMKYYAYRLQLVPVHHVGQPGKRGNARVKHSDLEGLIQRPAASRLRRVGA